MKILKNSAISHETNKADVITLTAGQKNFLHHQKMQKLYIFWSRILLFTAFVMLWQISSDLGWIDRFYFSSPIAIAKLFWHDIKDMSLLSHIGITLLESGVSFFLIIILSVLTATFFWFYPSLGKMFEPFLIVLNSLPKSALAPLIIVWLGTGSRTIILCGISVGIFGCILNLYQSFEQTDPERLKLIETLGGTKLQAFTKVVFPGNIPTFISLSKVNIGLALVGVIIGEFLAGKKGLGYLIIYGSQVFKLDMVILSIVILCIIAMGIYGLLNLLEKRI
ncbi:riboflavin transport system permease protein RibX [Lachnospiraceae bacterium]|nr:riboflavin transport system permease protein RibX [Lachnospiraceae bacterium]